MSARRNLTTVARHDPALDNADGRRMLEALEERQLETFAAIHAGLAQREQERAAAIRMLAETRLSDWAGLESADDRSAAAGNGGRGAEPGETASRGSSALPGVNR